MSRKEQKANDAKQRRDELTDGYIKTALKVQGIDPTPLNIFFKREEIKAYREKRAALANLTPREREKRKKDLERARRLTDPARYAALDAANVARRKAKDQSIRKQKSKEKSARNREELTWGYVAGTLGVKVSEMTTEQYEAKKKALLEFREQRAIALTKPLPQRWAESRERQKKKDPEEFKKRQRNASRKWLEKHPEKKQIYVQRRKEKIQANPEIYQQRLESNRRTAEKHKEKYREMRLKGHKELRWKSIVTHRMGLRVNECPPELFEIKRLQMLMNRKIKDLT